MARRIRNIVAVILASLAFPLWSVGGVADPNCPPLLKPEGGKLGSGRVVQPFAVGADATLSPPDLAAFAQASAAPEIFLRIAERKVWDETDLTALFGIASRNPQWSFARLIELSPGRLPESRSTDKLLNLYLGYRARALQDYGSPMYSTFSGHRIPKEIQSKHFVIPRGYAEFAERETRFLEAIELLGLGTDLDATHLQRFFAVISEPRPYQGYLNPKFQPGFYNPLSVEQARMVLERLGRRLPPVTVENFSNTLRVYIPGSWMYPGIDISSLLGRHESLLPVLKKQGLLKTPMSADLFKKLVDEEFLSVPAQSSRPLELGPGLPWVREGISASAPNGFLREAKYRQLLVRNGMETEAHTLQTWTRRMRELSWQNPRKPTELPRVDSSNKIEPEDVLVWLASIRDTRAIPVELLDVSVSRAERIRMAIESIEAEVPEVARELGRERLQVIFEAWISLR